MPKIELVGVKMRIKSLLADFTCSFWTFLFPVILIICFSITIPKDKNRSYQPVQVALVNNQGECMKLYRAMEQERTLSKRPLFRVRMCSEIMCKEKLNNKEIDVYVEYDEDYQVICNKQDAKTILVREYIEWYSRMKGKEKIDFRMQNILSKREYDNMDQSEIYLLTLLALSAFLSFHWGIRIAYDMQGNQSMLGLHLMITPLHKRNLILQSIPSVVLVELLYSLIFDFLVMLLRNLNLIPILPAVAGIQLLTSIVGGGAGFCWCNLLKGSLKSKYKRGEFIIFVAGFLSGMMVARVRYLVDIKMPLISRLNPVSVATDALFHVYYIKDTAILIEDICNLIGVGVILSVLGIRLSRRIVYEHL